MTKLVVTAIGYYDEAGRIGILLRILLPVQISMTSLGLPNLVSMTSLGLPNQVSVTIGMGTFKTNLKKKG